MPSNICRTNGRVRNLAILLISFLTAISNFALQLIIWKSRKRILFFATKSLLHLISKITDYVNNRKYTLIIYIRIMFNQLRHNQTPNIRISVICFGLDFVMILLS